MFPTLSPALSESVQQEESEALPDLNHFVVVVHPTEGVLSGEESVQVFLHPIPGGAGKGRPNHKLRRSNVIQRNHRRLSHLFKQKSHFPSQGLPQLDRTVPLPIQQEKSPQEETPSQELSDWLSVH